MVKEDKKSFWMRMFDNIPVLLWNYTFYTIIIGLVVFLVVQPQILTTSYAVSNQVSSLGDGLVYQQGNHTPVEVGYDSFAGFLIQLQNNVVICSFLVGGLLILKFYLENIKKKDGGVKK